MQPLPVSLAPHESQTTDNTKNKITASPNKKILWLEKKNVCDSPELTVWNCEKGLKICFGPDLQVMGASKTPSENAFIFLP